MNISGMVLITLCYTTLCSIIWAAKIFPADWMRDNMNILANRTLKQICIPGSHDSGMYQIKGKTFFAKKCNILTQSLPVGGQLKLGIRYFDVRPVISKRSFRTGHYTKVGRGWQGGNGQAMEAIVNDINDFTKTHKELIIVSISHSLNTDLGNTKYRPFNQGEWERFYQLLDKTNNMYLSGNISLAGVTLGQYTNNGKRAAVLYVFDKEVDFGGRYGRGYFYPNNLNIYNEYSNTDKFSVMAKDQLRKMKEMSRNKYFLLSWTLSQKGKDAVFCGLNGRSIKHFAAQANNKLGTIYPYISQAAYPNIIYVDDVMQWHNIINIYAEVAMDINHKLNF